MELIPFKFNVQFVDNYTCYTNMGGLCPGLYPISQRLNVEDSAN